MRILDQCVDQCVLKSLTYPVSGGFFLSRMAFSIYEVVCVACLARSSYFL